MINPLLRLAVLNKTGVNVTENSKKYSCNQIVLYQMITDIGQMWKRCIKDALCNKCMQALCEACHFARPLVMHTGG